MLDAVENVERVICNNNKVQYITFGVNYVPSFPVWNNWDAGRHKKNLIVNGRSRHVKIFGFLVARLLYHNSIGRRIIITNYRLVTMSESV